MKRKIRNWFGVWLSAILIIAATVIPSAPAAAAVGAVSLSVTSGQVGTAVSVTGTGFTAGSKYTVYFESTAVASGTVAADRTVSTSFNVPDYWRGTHAVRVTTDAPDTSNTAYFTVVSSIVLSTASGQVGMAVTIAGHGFAAGTTANLYFDSVVITSVTTGASGQFTGYLTVPAAVAGSHTIKAADSGGSSPNMTFTVTPLISLNPSAQIVGSQVVITGSGYHASATVSFYLDGAVISGMTATTNATGGFTYGNFVVPALVGGSHTITAADNYSNSNSVVLTVKQAITLSPVSGPTGSSISIGGTGFGASKVITVTYGSSSVATDPSSIATDTRGSFNAHFTVPSGYAGSYTVQASDGTLSAAANFTVSGGASLSSGSGPAGTSVTVNGSNFNAVRSVIIRYDNIQMGTALTGVTGAFTFSFKVPNSAGGSHTVTCTDGIDTISLPFVVTANMTLSDSTATVGSEVAVNGYGFAASHAVAISYDNKIVSTVNTDSAGSFTTGIKVPASVNGTHLITATDNANTSSVPVKVKAGGSLSIVNGNVSADVVINGSGFGAGRTCTVKWDDTILAAANTDAAGSFTTSVKIPAAGRGLHVVFISDGTSSVALSFNIESAVTLAPSSGNVGENVTVEGSGFSPVRKISISYDGNEVGQATTDSEGSFTMVLEAPASRGGNHVVTVSDSTATVNATFAMDSVAPPVPTALKPVNNSKAGAQAKFSWMPVTDPSGVTYTFQIATGPEFSDIIVDKTGLTNAAYTLTKDESLKSVSNKNPYYWRVRAVDGASNASPWSTAQSFYVGFVMPAALLYTIFAIALVLVFLIGFLLGRRRRSSL